MKSSLSDRCKAILTAIQHRALEPLTRAAKQLNLKEHVVRHEVERMIASGVLVQRVPFINTYPLGFEDYEVYFSLAPLRPLQRSKVVESLSRRTGVSWLAMTAGEFEYAMAVSARSVEEISLFFEGLSAEFGDIFLNRSIAIIRSFFSFGRRHLHSKPLAVPMLAFGHPANSVTIDRMDARILTVLCKSGFPSLRDLARAVETPHSTIDRRLRDLVQKQIISGWIWRINNQSLGVLTYRLLINARGISAALSEQVQQFCSKRSEILKLIKTIGAWDYEIEAEVSSPEQIGQLVEKLSECLGASLQNVRLLQVFRHLRYCGFPFSATSFK